MWLSRVGAGGLFRSGGPPPLVGRRTSGFGQGAGRTPHDCGRALSPRRTRLALRASGSASAGALPSQNGPQTDWDRAQELLRAIAPRGPRLAAERESIPPLTCRPKLLRARSGRRRSPDPVPALVRSTCAPLARSRWSMGGRTTPILA